jgi:tetracycline repressor-like protein
VAPSVYRQYRQVSVRSFYERTLILISALGEVNPDGKGCVPIEGGAESFAAERIRRAAIEAFAESGYRGCSTRHIAGRLNMSASAMYAQRLLQ